LEFYVTEKCDFSIVNHRQFCIIKQVHINTVLLFVAQDLLQQWVDEKIHINHHSDEYFEEPKKTQAEIRREWDHLLDLDKSDEDDDHLDLKSAFALRKRRGTNFILHYTAL
jgi:hypothetical protein